MAKKKRAGLSRKQIQRLTRQTRIKRFTTGSRLLPEIYGSETPDGTIKIELKSTRSGLVVAGKSHERLPIAKLATKRIFASTTTAHKCAAIAVEASTKEIFESLGINVLRGMAVAPPEVVHKVGKLVATRAISMAGELMAVGSPDGGGHRGHGVSVGVGRIIDAIGHSGVEVSINSDGEVSAKATPKKPKKKKTSKPAKTKESKTEDNEKTPTGKSEVTTTKDGLTSVIKEGSNPIIINLYFEFHFDKNEIKQVNINSGKVNNYDLSQKEAVKQAVECVLTEAGIIGDKPITPATLPTITQEDDDKEEDDDDGENKKKKSGKGKK